MKPLLNHTTYSTQRARTASRLFPPADLLRNLSQSLTFVVTPAIK